MEIAFETTLREQLQLVPLKIRQTWGGSELHAWFIKAQREDSFPTREWWLWVLPLVCHDLIGKDAVV